ncbi:MAG: hypothetical protein ABG776_18250 [Cyanobacteria bacterium J06555_13]
MHQDYYSHSDRATQEKMRSRSQFLHCQNKAAGAKFRRDIAFNDTCLATTSRYPPRPAGTPPERGSTSVDEAKSSLLRSHNAASPGENPLLGGVAGALAEVGVGRDMTRLTNNCMYSKHINAMTL